MYSECHKNREFLELMIVTHSAASINNKLRIMRSQGGTVTVIDGGGGG